MKSNEQLRKEFEEQTGNKAIVFPACHGETGYASWEYQLWLEQKLLEEYAQQSQPSGMRWVREKPANDREFVLVTASLINGEWHYHGWEIIEVPDGYFALCELHGEEWGPYEDLSAEYYLVLSPVSESSPAGAAEGANDVDYLG